jgi:S-adenosylmethionine hydrolase
MPRVVTLTTDFGSGSGYVAEMKGRLLRADASCTLVDIAHDLPPQDIRAAAWLVGQACFSFPADSIHIVVVDPGVGTSRRLIWAACGTPDSGRQQFLCPDNGLLSWAMHRHPLVAAHVLAVPQEASATFHGRDVLVPAAGRLLSGASPETLGPPVAAIETLPLPEPQETSAGIHGEVIHVDSFGNLVTNLPAALLPRLVVAGGLRIGAQTIRRIVRTYGDAVHGTPVVLVGSQGFIEVAVVEGRAADVLSARAATPVAIEPPVRSG